MSFTTKNPIKTTSILQKIFKNRASFPCTAPPQALYPSTFQNGPTPVQQHLNFVDFHPQIKRYASSGHIKKAVQDLYFVCQTPTVYDLNSLINSYLSSKDVNFSELIGVFDGMKKFGPWPNALTYNSMVKGMISLGRFKDGVFLAEEMCGRGFVPSFSILSRLFKRAMELGSFLDGVSLLEMMLRLGYSPKEDSLNEIILSLSSRQFIGEAYSMFLVMLEKGCYDDAYNYNPIVWALCKSKQSYLALAFFCFVKKKGCMPNVCSYTALVYGFCQEGLWDEAYSCLKGMERDGCDPNVITYSIMIKFLCGDGKVDEAFRLLDAMERKGYTPDMVAYNILFRELCDKDKVIEVGDFQITEKKGYSPYQYTHAALAGGMLKCGKIEMAHKFLLDLMHRGWHFNDMVYNMYFQSLYCENNSTEAISVVKRMGKIGFTHTDLSYNIILKGLWMEKDLDGILELFERIDCASGGTDMISFNTILSAACKQGNSAMIRRIMHKMEYEGIKMDIVGYTRMVQYFSKVKKLRECLQPLGSMIIRGHIPSIVTFNTLINELCQSGQLETALQVFKYLKSCNWPDVTTYNILLRASIIDGNNNLVDQLSSDMYSHRLKPDVVTFECFALRLCREGKISKACQLRHNMIALGITPNTGIYNIILEAMLKKDKFSEIIGLLKNMAVDGCEPNDDSVLILTRAISKGWMKSYPGAGKLILRVMGGKPVKVRDEIAANDIQ